MKVLALVIFAVASVSGLGSGPYLPSGWRPQGPAFYLPSEGQKPADNPLKETIFQETEASGSDALREYGPPKVSEVSQDLTSQALPDAVTEQAFVVIAKTAEEVGGEVREISEVKAEVIGEEVKEAVTEAVEAIEVIAEEKSTEAVTEAVEEKTTAALESAFEGRAIDVAIEETVEQEATSETVETTTAAEAVSVEVTEAVAAVVDSNVESSQVEQVSHVQEVSQVPEVGQVAVEIAEVRTAEAGVKEVAEALVNLEKEIKSQQVQNEDAIEVKSVQVLGQHMTNRQAELPEGFLEYGPPGFREYGPPQADELLRSGAVVQDPTEEEKKVENNETRRRRFSPKFRSSKKQH